MLAYFSLQMCEHNKNVYALSEGTNQFAYYALIFYVAMLIIALYLIVNSIVKE